MDTLEISIESTGMIVVYDKKHGCTRYEWDQVAEFCQEQVLLHPWVKNIRMYICKHVSEKVEEVMESFAKHLYVFSHAHAIELLEGSNDGRYSEKVKHAVLLVCKNMKELNLQSAFWPTKNVKHWCQKLIETCSHLETLMITESPQKRDCLGPQHVRHLMHMVMALPNLTLLSISEQDIGNYGAIEMARQLHKTRLTHLDVSRNKIGQRGCNALRLALHHPMCQIMDLNVLHNHFFIDWRWIQTLSEVSRLKQISMDGLCPAKLLQHTLLPSTASMGFPQLELLQWKPPVEHDLLWQWFLSYCCHKDCRLKQVEFTGLYCMTDKQMREWLDAIEHMTCLTHVCFHLDAKENRPLCLYYRFSHVLAHHPTLKHIEFGQTYCRTMYFRIIYSCLRYNDQIQTLGSNDSRELWCMQYTKNSSWLFDLLTKYNPDSNFQPPIPHGEFASAWKRHQLKRQGRVYYSIGVVPKNNQKYPLFEKALWKHYIQPYLIHRNVL
jgi:hypothetical protein